MTADGRDRSWCRLTDGWEYNQERQLMWHESCGTVPCTSGSVPAYIQRGLIPPASTDDGWDHLKGGWWYHSQTKYVWHADFDYLKVTDISVPFPVRTLIERATSRPASSSISASPSSTQQDNYEGNEKRK